MVYKISALVIAIVTLGYFYFSPSKTIEETLFNEVPSHEKWSALLQKNVNTNGDVNYKAFLQDKAALEEYLTLLQKNSPAKLIVDNYPTKSIKDIKSPWDKDVVAIGDKMYSLGYIEHKVLRKMNEPRIHFAINCASYSCPKLVNKAFLANTMDAQLETAAKDFISDKKRNKINANDIQLSEIFKWFKSDFTESTSLIGFINKYATVKIAEDARVKYIDYNWSLNEAK